MFCTKEAADLQPAMPTHKVAGRITNIVNLHFATMQTKKEQGSTDQGVCFVMYSK